MKSKGFIHLEKQKIERTKLEQKKKKDYYTSAFAIYRLIQVDILNLIINEIHGSQ